MAVGQAPRFIPYYMRDRLFLLALCLAALRGLGDGSPTEAPPLRILPLGDSITYGLGAAGGYRAPLFQLLTNAGYQVDYVGTQSDNSAPGLPDPAHEGHLSWTIRQLGAIIPDVIDKIADPDVILLLVGTNDYSQEDDPANATNRLESLIVNLATLRPYAKIIVANLLPREEPFDSEIQSTFNPALPGLVQRQRDLGREVYFNNLRSAVSLSDFPDQLHPGAAGYRKLATNWLGAITNLFSPEGSSNPPAIARINPWAGLTNLTVVFSKPVADETVVAGNFSVSGGVTVQAATLDPATRREVTLTTSPLLPARWYRLTVNGVSDRTSGHLTISSTVGFKSSAGSGASLNVPEAANYELVYSLAIPDSPDFAGGVTYDVDQRAAVSRFSRIAYYLELQQSGGALNWVWVSLDAFTTNVNLIGVPTAGSGALFQQPVTNMTVLSDVAGIVTGINLSGGNLEFWPSNNSPANAAGVANASNTAYDWGDQPSPGAYGSMQVHNHAAQQVLFAFNGWSGTPGAADLGIGNHTGNYLDWTFAHNSASYGVKTLQVFVLPATASFSVAAGGFPTSNAFSLRWPALSGTAYSIWWKPRLDAAAWTKVGATTPTTTTGEFLDTQATNTAGFYQISAP